MLGVEACWLSCDAKYAGDIDLQIVAFPQEGIEKVAGTLQLMRRATEFSG